MSLIETVTDFGNKLFNRVSKNSNARANKSNSSNSKYSSYTSLFDREDNRVPYKLGRSILRDTQVGTGFDILKYLLSSKKWVLTNSEEDTEIYDFILDMLNNMDKEINTVIKQMTNALAWGFSVHEIIFDVNENGRIVVKNLVPIHIKTLQNDPFTYNENGDLISIHQEVDKYSIEIPEYKCLLYSFGSQYDELESDGLLNDFLPIVEDKENLMDWLMTFNEKNESPTLYGKTDDPTSRDELLDVFESIADGTTGVVVGKEDDVGVLESSHRGETYFKTLQYKDNQIFRRMFIGNLLMGDNSQTGTYAQSQTQLEFGQLIFDGILEEKANVFQEQVINPIVEFNFGKGRKAPIISFDKFTSGDMKKLFEIITPLIDKGIIDSENKAVHESLTLLFKSEAGVEYINEEPEMPKENFNYQPTPTNTEDLTNNIIKDLNAITE